MQKLFKKSMMLLFVLAIALALYACGGEKSDVGDDQTFTWWITRTDGMGTFYQDYEDNPGVQWINNQYWNLDTGTYSNEGNGTKLNFKFQVPITGAESDNFNTMIATGSYPEIIDLSYSVDSSKQLFDDGILTEITEYVEAYMPDYLAFIEAHPQVKPFVSYTDENGDAHYYALYGFNNVMRPQWQGYAYRRDWVVKYAEPTPYVWDLESDFVVANGHPKYTPLSVAQSQNDYTGWKQNAITEFTSNFGDVETWEDNVIFPSGSDVPMYISDWEWMFEAFSEAIEAEGFANNTNAYVTTIPFQGYNETGNLVSSFGGGGPMWYIDDQGDAVFGATSSNFKTYVEAMHNWYENGWLDTRFDTRSSDSFWKINLTGSSQGMVGLFDSGSAYLGTTIRVTASNPDAKNHAMVYPSPLPINDVYGDDSNKFKKPDTYYSANLINTITGFTDKIEGKDLPTLFTMLNWQYTEEGALFHTFGLTKEMYENIELSPDLYEEYNLDAAYQIVTDESGNETIVTNVPTDLDLSNAVRAMRMDAALTLHPSDEYNIDSGYSDLVATAKRYWSMYDNTGFILDHADLFNDDQSTLYSKIRTYITTDLNIQIPGLIKNGLGGWDTYVTKINKYGPDRVTTEFQVILDSIK